MGRTLTAQQVLSITNKTVEMTGAWGDCLGTIDRTGVVFVWGNSGNGKTTAVMQLCKELAKFGKVLYVSIEEGTSLSIQNTIRRCHMEECHRRFQLVEDESIEDLSARLEKRKSPDFVVIDSFQYAQLSFREYKSFVARHRKKLLIFVSHADGRIPAGRPAQRVMYTAGLKLWVEGYKCFSKGRFIGSTGEYTIWKEGAEKYWGK